MPALSTTIGLDPERLIHAADWAAVGVAVALPWSTTATGILIAVWLVVLLPALDGSAIKRQLMTGAGGLPVLLWGLAVAGMLWADVSWTDRLNGLGGFNRLLAIPLLLAQFRQSEQASRVFSGFLISSVGVLLISFALVIIPDFPWPSHVRGVPVHDDIFQGSTFLICALGALGYAAIEFEKGRKIVATAFIAIGVLFLANFAFVTISRVSLLVAPVLLVLLGWRIRQWKGALSACVLLAMIGTLFWVASSAIRHRMETSVQEIDEYLATGAATSIGMHAAFLKESMPIVAGAPVIGHGTGSIREQFRRITAGETGAAAVATDNPHNQTFAVAIQLGLIGAFVLWAMWIAHFFLFRGAGIAAWMGTVVVVENFVSSAAHSHLFDFNSGWLYVLGVGVAGGAALRERSG